jgi:hypothetical protein
VVNRRGTWLVATVALVAVAAAAAFVFRGEISSWGDTPAEVKARAMELREEQIRVALLDALQPVKLSNCQLERFGEAHDGGYLMCANLLGSAGAGYSYGISNYDQWGCDVSRKLNVRVHQYDCFDTRQPSCPGGDTMFHPECVSYETFVEEGRPFDTLASQMRKNGDEGKHVVAKMDVEGAEWDSLLFAPDEVYERIDQLVLEFHGFQDEKYAYAIARVKKFFHVVNLHFNNFSCGSGREPFPAWAYEVLFVNKKLGTVDPSGTVSLPNPLDAPNSPSWPDCQEWSR